MVKIWQVSLRKTFRYTVIFAIEKIKHCSVLLIFFLIQRLKLFCLVHFVYICFVSLHQVIVLFVFLYVILFVVVYSIFVCSFRFCLFVYLFGCLLFVVFVFLFIYYLFKLLTYITFLHFQNFEDTLTSP